MNYLILNLVIFNRIISEIIYAPASARGYFPLPSPLPPPSEPSSHLFLYPLSPAYPSAVTGRAAGFSVNHPPRFLRGLLPRVLPTTVVLLRVEIFSKTRNSRGNFVPSRESLLAHPSNYPTKLGGTICGTSIFVGRTHFSKSIHLFYFCNN